MKTTFPVEWWCAYDNTGDGTSPATPFGSLNAAIAAASAGDTIYLVGDMRGEAVVIDKAVRIVGLTNALPNPTRILGPNATSTVVTITADSVQLENISIRGGGTGSNFTGTVLLLDGSSGCSLRQMNVQGLGTGTPTAYPTSPGAGSGVGGCGIVFNNGEGHYLEQVNISSCSIGLVIGTESSTNVWSRGRMSNCYQDMVMGLLTNPDFDPVTAQPWAYGGGNGGGWTFLGVKDVSPVFSRDPDTPVIDLIGDGTANYGGSNNGNNHFIACDFSESGAFQTIRVGSGGNVFSRLVVAPASTVTVEGIRNHFLAPVNLGAGWTLNSDDNMVDGGIWLGVITGDGNRNRLKNISFKAGPDLLLGITGDDWSFEGCTFDHTGGGSDPTGVSVLGTRPKFVREESLVAPTYGTTVNTDLRQGTYFVITATNSTGFTIANPTDSSNATPANLMVNKQITYDIVNSSGGALGTITWGSHFKLAGAFTAPADGKRRTITFMIVSATVHVEVSRAGADI